jgi:hypothetical protein
MTFMGQLDDFNHPFALVLLWVLLQFSGKESGCTQPPEYNGYGAGGH